MFGRIRSSPLSAESLELESPPPKLFKQDSLSIFEATLVKLKQGSQRCLASEHVPMEFETNSDTSEGSPKVYGLCSDQGLLPVSGSDSSGVGVSSSPNQEQKKGREVSIHYLFSKYASSRQKQGSTSKDSSPCSLMNNSGCSSDSELSGCS